MRWKQPIFVVAAICLAPTWTRGAHGPRPAAKPAVQTETGQLVLFPDRTPGSLEDSPYLTRGQSTYRREVAARFGWWGVSVDGSEAKVGEWQGLESSAFWDVDGITSDGHKTVSYTLTGTQDEGLDANWYYFGPHLTAEIDIQRFIHRLGFKPLDAWFNTPNNSTLVGQDFNETTDNAVRVQRLDAQFKGHLTEHVSWGLNVWGMRKFGERQKMELNHNCTGRQCHMVTQTQTINWLTMEIEPVIEAEFGPVTAEYTRTMRAFEQDDEVVSRSYTGRPVEFIDPTLQYPYAVVPENFTQIDRLKVGVDVTQNTRFYTLLFTGNTHNKNRQTDRGFWGADLRLTNHTFDSLSVTGFAKRYEESNQIPTTFPEDPLFPAGQRPSDEVRHPVDRQKTSAGFDARWYPSLRRHRLSGLTFTGGYEYSQIERQFVTYEILGPPSGGSTFTQPDTVSNLMRVGVDMRWSKCLTSYLRYKMVTTDNPLLGVRENDETTSDPDLEFPSPDGITALNTKLPKQVDRIEFGGTWTPTYNFLLSAMIGIEQRSHLSAAADFDEDDYPLIFTSWYAPTPQWSISGGLGFYSNWIDQDITFGNGHVSPRGDEPQDTQRVAYGGRADVVNLGTTYDCTDRLTLTGGFEWVRGQNTWTVPSPDNADWSTMPGFSNVVVETTRLSTGVDYWLRDGISCYVRYIYYDYDDKTDAFNSGTTDMFLGGVSAVF